MIKNEIDVIYRELVKKKLRLGYFILIAYQLSGII